MKNKENKECVPLEAMPHAQSPTSPEALSRLEAEKREQIKYYYFDARTSALSIIPPTVDRVDLSSRRKGEYLVKTRGGMVTEIRPFRDEEILEQEMKDNLKERIEKILEPKEFKIDYEPFDPEAELKNIRKYDKETRPEKLEEYKRELIRQKQGIAEIQNNLEQQIRGNPDLNQEELMKTVSAKAPEYRLSDNQLNLFQETLNRYVEKHQAVREARKQYGDDRELFKACFGKKPEGVVEVIEGPVTLYFRCHDLKDYAWIKREKFLQPPKKQKIKRSDLNIAKNSGGYFPPCLIPSLDNAITVLNASLTQLLSPDDPWIKGTQIHEEQHAINRLFKEQWFDATLSQVKSIYDKVFEDKEIKDYVDKELAERKSSVLLNLYLKSIKKIFENRTRDEILAFSKEKYYSTVKIRRILLRPLDDGGLYDYFSKQKKRDRKESQRKINAKNLQKKQKRNS